MIRVACVLALFAACGPVWAADSPTMVIAPPGSGTTIMKINGETVVMKKIPGGAIGKIGGEKVIMLDDGRGNSIVKMGQTKLICHSDPASGATICK